MPNVYYFMGSKRPPPKRHFTKTSIARRSITRRSITRTSLARTSIAKLSIKSERNTKPIKLDLNLEIKDFGPITHGKIKLKPLTVFVGPNNSGKSYVALLIRSFLKTESRLINYFTYTFDFDNTYNLLEKKINKLGTKKSITISSTTINKFIKNTMSRIIKTQFPEDLTKIFSSELIDLKRIGAKSCSIKINSNILNADMKFHDNDFKVTNIKCPNLIFKINLDQPDVKSNFCTTINGNMITIDIRKTDSRSQMLILIYDAIHSSVLNYLQNYIPNTAFYFPAARSGILQSYKMIIASLIQNIPSEGLKNLESPHISSIMRDFLQDILHMPSAQGQFSNHAKDLEREIFHGTIKLDSNTLNPVPEIKFTHKKHDIPLHRTSSAISELTPFILYVKHLISIRNVLIIEEPEAHLHPRNQILFAKFLVRLIREDLNIVLTTHSPFILEHLNNFLKIRKLSSKIRIKEFGLREDDYLKSDEISIYQFKQSTVSDNHIKLLKISKEDGISQEEFVKVNKEMYEKSLAVHHHLNGDYIDFK